MSPILRASAAFVRGLLGVVLVQLAGLLRHLLLELLQVGGRVLRLLAELLLGLAGLLLGLLGLLEGLGDLVGRVHRRHLRLELGLVVRLLSLLVGQRLGEFLGRVLQVLGGLLAFLRGRVRASGRRGSSRPRHLLAGLVDLLGRLGSGVLHLVRRCPWPPA